MAVPHQTYVPQSLRTASDLAMQQAQQATRDDRTVQELAAADMVLAERTLRDCEKQAEAAALLLVLALLAALLLWGSLRRSRRSADRNSAEHRGRHSAHREELARMGTLLRETLEQTARHNYNRGQAEAKYAALVAHMDALAKRHQKRRLPEPAHLGKFGRNGRIAEEKAP